EDQAVIEQKVNDLLSQRTELEAQLALYKEQGDSEAMLRTQEEIEAVNIALQEAIANAVAMHEAIGGTGSAASIAALQTMRLEAENLDLSGKKNKVTWQSLGEMFAGGLTNAFMSFSQAVANGE